MEFCYQHQVSAPAAVGAPAWGCWALVLLASVLPAGANVAGWLDLRGVSLRGESKERSHVDWVEIEGFGIRGPQPTGEPGAFQLVKRPDRSSPGLYLACAQSSSMRDVVLDLNLGLSQGTPPVRIELRDALVTGHGMELQPGRPLETISLAFSRIVYTYIETDGAKVVSIYDQTTGSGSSSGSASPDSDGDGLLDSWETQYGLQVGVNDSAGDPDGDGMSNLDEFRLGTHPRSGASFFRVALQPVQGYPTLWNLQWNSVAGKTYVVEWSRDLKTPFAEVQTVTANSATSNCLVGRAAGVGFYRVRLQ